MLLSNLESFFLHHQEQTHLLPSDCCRKQQIVLTQILSGTWLCHQGVAANRPCCSAHAGGQQGGGTSFLARSELCSTASWRASTEEGQGRSGTHQSCLWRKAGDAETDNSSWAAPAWSFPTSSVLQEPKESKESPRHRFVRRKEGVVAVSHTPPSGRSSCH